MLRDVMERSFVLVPAVWSTGDVKSLLRRLEPSHLIVHYPAVSGTEAYYLLRPAHLADANDTAPLHEVLRLNQRAATPTFDAYDDEVSAPSQAVVLDEGRVIGFLDADIFIEAKDKEGIGPFGDIFGQIFGRALRQSASGPLDRTLESESVQPTRRSLVTDFPRQVIIGETNSLLVSLSRDRSAGKLVLVAASGMVVDVVIRPRRGFELVGLREGSISVTESEESVPLQFKLRATDVGLGAFQICIFSCGRSLGVLTIESRVEASSPSNGRSGGSMPTRSEKPLPPSMGKTVPDLTLIITERERYLSFVLRTSDAITSPKIKQEFGPVQIKAEPLTYFRDFFAKIRNLPTGSAADQHQAEQELGALGDLLFHELIPQDLQELLWTQRQNIHTVQIQSQEPWIPWELCRLRGWDNGRIRSGEFFAEAFAITRWLPGPADKLTLVMRKLALVVPTTSGLAHAPCEKEYMLSLGDGERTVTCIPANRDDVLVALKDGGYDCWHFTGHGKMGEQNPDFAKLELDNGVISPALLGGEVENLGLHQPLVFLNACQSGRLAMSLTDVGGWAARFLCAAADVHPTFGAAAFIGTFWEIDDLAALEFAKAFYGALLHDKQPVGDAVKQARSAIRTLGGLDRLAYTVFAHPLAKVM